MRLTASVDSSTIFEYELSGVECWKLARFSPTVSRSRVGTLGYVAPEQASGEPDIDSRIDVFSLGCVFFECLTGQVAFYGARPVAVLAKILFGEMPRVRSFRPDISPEPAALLDTRFDIHVEGDVRLLLGNR